MAHCNFSHMASYRSDPKSRLKPDRTCISGVGHVRRIPKFETRPALLGSGVPWFLLLHPTSSWFPKAIHPAYSVNQIACHGYLESSCNSQMISSFQEISDSDQHHSD